MSPEVLMAMPRHEAPFVGVVDRIRRWKNDDPNLISLDMHAEETQRATKIVNEER